jgi:hypothetical protein
MALSRHLGVAGILGASWLAALGCDDHGDKLVFDHVGAAGAPASAGTGGKASGGSSASGAGQAGMAEVEAGGAAAGAPPAPGAGGMLAQVGGSVGEPGGAAGSAAAGTAAADGGQAGSASGGGGGEGGAPLVALAQQCVYPCEVDADCKILPSNTNNKCDPVTKHCGIPNPTCAVADDCAPSASFWSGACASDADCDTDFESCITWQGQGYCAGLNDPDSGCTLGDPILLPRFGAVGNADVCASLTSRCSAEGCVPGCADPYVGGCSSGNGDICNTITGLCECTLNSECTNGTSVCGANAHCECASNADCAGSGLDVCVAGTCGCSAASACPASRFFSAPAACE